MVLDEQMALGHEAAQGQAHRSFPSDVAGAHVLGHEVERVGQVDGDALSGRGHLECLFER
jgi:hypothetical protein